MVKVWSGVQGAGVVGPAAVIILLPQCPPTRQAEGVGYGVERGSKSEPRCCATMN